VWSIVYQHNQSRINIFCNFTPFNTRRWRQQQLRLDTLRIPSQMCNLLPYIGHNLCQSSVFKSHITFEKIVKSLVRVKIRNHDLWIQKRGTKPDLQISMTIELTSRIHMYVPTYYIRDGNLRFSKFTAYLVSINYISQ